MIQENSAIVFIHFEGYSRHHAVLTSAQRGLSMAKKTIKAKELLADIRAGLDDASLMKKYGFSARRNS